jgi:hypothetical protein
MPNVLLINNTETYHSGCKAVIDYYRSKIPNLHIAKNLDVDVSTYDVVIANGEGTMHHDADRAYQIIDLLCNAKYSMLVNTVWQANSINLTKQLRNIDYVSVREVKSQYEIYNQIGIKFDRHLDLSYFTPVEYIDKPKYNIVAGNKMNVPKTKPKKPKIKGVGEDGYVDIFTQTWNDLVSQIKNSNILVTGRHHEMYAACVAETPFIVIEGNTHKNQGLFATAMVDIPVLPFGCSNAEITDAINNIKNYTNEYNNLFAFMKQQKPLEFEYAGVV